MNPEERVKLNDLVEDFVQQVVNFDALLESLVEKNILTVSFTNYINKAGNETEVKRELIRTIAKRGPSAYNHFLLCLKATGNEEFSKNLEQRKSQHHGVKKGIYKMDYNHDKCYRMRSYPKGIALIINIYSFTNGVLYEDRNGSEKDVENLENLWKELGYKVIKESNLTAKELRQCVKDFSQNQELLNVDSSVVFIMSHGKSTQDTQGVYIVCQDDKLVHSQQLIYNFTVSSCPALACKPKLFIFQACRGDLLEKGVDKHALRLSQLSLNDKVKEYDLNYQRSKSEPIDRGSRAANHSVDFAIADSRTVNGDDDMDTSSDKLNNNDVAVSSNGLMGSEDGNSQKSNMSENSAKIIDENAFVQEADIKILVNGNTDIDLDNKMDLGKGVNHTTTDSKVSRQSDHGSEGDRTVAETSDEVHNLGNYTDILTVYSTIPGYVSLRDINDGSWLIQELFKVFSEKAYHHDLLDMLTMVMRNLEKRTSKHHGLQLMHYENLHFNKKLFFNPGLYH